MCYVFCDKYLKKQDTAKDTIQYNMKVKMYGREKQDWNRLLPRRQTPWWQRFLERSGEIEPAVD